MGNTIDDFFNLILFYSKPVIEILETNHENWKKKTCCAADFFLSLNGSPD